MLTVMDFGIFGSPVRDRILKLLVLIEDSYPRQLAERLDERLYTVQRAVGALQAAGIVTSRLVGTIRRVELNPTWYAASELRVLLRRMAQADPGLCALAGSIRRRPRRARKAL